MSAHSVALIDQIAAALSANSVKHQVIAGNIANRDTVGFQRMKVRFEQAMDRAAAPSIVADDVPAPVSLEQDLVALTTNAMQYQGMARTLGHYFEIISIITSSPRG